MQIEEGAARKSRQHTQYKLADGTLIPGVTTPLGVLAKPALIPWANALGLQGIKVREYVDQLAEIGTLAHAMVQAHLQGVKPDVQDYTSSQVSRAENSLLSFFEWEKSHRLKPLLLEKPLISEKYRFGGTVDCYGYLDGVATLIDFKTSKAIYDEHFYQVSAYWKLLEEAGFLVERAMILQIGREETEGFSVKVVGALSREWEIFLHALAIYELKKNGKRKSDK